MKQTAFSIIAILLLNSCLNKKTTSEKEPHQVEKVQAIDSDEESVATLKDTLTEYSDYKSTDNEIPPSGTYRFDIAFAEWQGKSMGEKVTVKIDGDSIRVIYEGVGNLSLTEKGEAIDEGKIMKHKSGKWIIGTKESDRNLDEVGGCSGGPAIIDFQDKKYWMC